MAFAPRYSKSASHRLCHIVGTASMVAALCFSALLPGCVAPTRRWQPETPPAELDDMRYVHYLASVPVVTVDEGMRAVLMLSGPSQRWPTYGDRYNELLRQGVVKDAWDLKPNQLLNKGTLAYMISVVCRTPRSVSEFLSAATGLGDRRYALRTCIDEGLLPYGRAVDPVSGGELVTALTAADRCFSERAADGP